MTHHIDNYMTNTVTPECVKTTMQKAIAMSMGTINTMYEHHEDTCMLSDSQMSTLKDCMKVISMAYPMIK